MKYSHTWKKKRETPSTVCLVETGNRKERTEVPHRLVASGAVDLSVLIQCPTNSLKLFPGLYLSTHQVCVTCCSSFRLGCNGSYLQADSESLNSESSIEFNGMAASQQTGASKRAPR